MGILFSSSDRQSHKLVPGEFYPSEINNLIRWKIPNLCIYSNLKKKKIQEFLCKVEEKIKMIFYVDSVLNIFKSVPTDGFSHCVCLRGSIFVYLTLFSHFLVCFLGKFILNVRIVFIHF